MFKRSQNYLGQALGNRRGLQRGGLTSLGYQEGGEVGADPHFIYTGQGIMSNQGGDRESPYNPFNPFAETNPELTDLNLDSVIDQADLDIFNSQNNDPIVEGQPSDPIEGQPSVIIPEPAERMGGLMWSPPTEAQAGFNPYFEQHPYLTDLNNDGRINVQDFGIYSSQYDDMEQRNELLNPSRDGGSAIYNPYFSDHPDLTDLNDDGRINVQDFSIYSQQWNDQNEINKLLDPNREGGAMVYNPYYDDHPSLTDLNNDGRINTQDFAIYSQNFNDRLDSQAEDIDYNQYEYLKDKVDYELNPLFNPVEDQGVNWGDTWFDPAHLQRIIESGWSPDPNVSPYKNHQWNFATPFEYNPDDIAKFDWEYYVNSNPDLIAAGIDTEHEALKHYLLHGYSDRGAASGYAPEGTERYLPTDPEAAAAAAAQMSEDARLEARGSNPLVNSHPGITDLNGDGLINTQDFAIYSQNFNENKILNESLKGQIYNPYHADHPGLTDLNGDGLINVQDFGLYSQQYGDLKSQNDLLGMPGGDLYNPYWKDHPYLTDLNNNGVINVQDFAIFSQMYPDMIAANKSLGPQGWTSQEWDLADNPNIAEGGFFAGDPSNPQVYNPYFEEYPWLSDLNNDGLINVQDFGIYSGMYPGMKTYNESLGDAGNPYFDTYPGLTDMNGDGRINTQDFGIFSSQWSDMVAANEALNRTNTSPYAPDPSGVNVGYPRTGNQMGQAGVAGSQATIANAGSNRGGYQGSVQMGWGTGQPTPKDWYGGFSGGVMDSKGGLSEEFRQAIKDPYEQFKNPAQQQQQAGMGQQLGANQQAAGGFGASTGGIGSLPTQNNTTPGPFNFSASPTTFGSGAIS